MTKSHKILIYNHLFNLAGKQKDKKLQITNSKISKSLNIPINTISDTITQLIKEKLLIKSFEKLKRYLQINTNTIRDGSFFYSKFLSTSLTYNHKKYPSFLSSKKLCSSEKVVLLSIYSLNVSNNKKCYASNTYFANLLKVSRGRVSQIIRKLIIMGLIKVVYTGDNRQIYTFITNTNLKSYKSKRNRLHFNNKIKKESILTSITAILCNLFSKVKDVFNKLVSKPSTSIICPNPEHSLPQKTAPPSQDEECYDRYGVEFHKNSSQGEKIQAKLFSKCGKKQLLSTNSNDPFNFLSQEKKNDLVHNKSKLFKNLAKQVFKRLANKEKLNEKCRIIFGKSTALIQITGEIVSQSYGKKLECKITDIPKNFSAIKNLNLSINKMKYILKEGFIK